MTIGIVLTAVALYASRARLGDAFRNLGHIRPAWLGVALAAELASMAAFARMQRRLLAAGGLVLSVPAALAVTYAGNAVAVTLPVAGSATGTRFTFKRWVQRGADPAVAAWGLLMAGIFSTSALAIIGGIGGLVAGNITTGILGTALTLLGIAPFIVILVALRRPRWRGALTTLSTPPVARVLAFRGRDPATAQSAVESFFDRIAAVRIGTRTGIGVAAFALLNWVADIGCLAACFAAFGADVPWTRLILLYLAGIGAATLSLTPAGIGVVEVALAATATSFGIAKNDAMASALLYRGISTWLVISAGWIIFAVLRRTPTPTPTPTPVDLEGRFPKPSINLARTATRADIQPQHRGDGLSAEQPRQLHQRPTSVMSARFRREGVDRRETRGKVDPAATPGAPMLSLDGVSLKDTVIEFDKS